MTNSKTTRRALVLSLLSLLLCCSMLVGTTFAWFTDSVTSGNNKIVAGNLDVELEYYANGAWNKVTENTNVFEKDTLWEPGHTEVVYLRIANLGTLALDYSLGVNIAYELTSTNVAGEELKLSNYIQMGVIDDKAEPYADRAAARAAVTNAKPINEGYATTGTLYPVNNVPTTGGKTEQYLALVVYMPEEVGNEANYKTGYAAPEITLGINLMAKQETYEEDSFDHLYDKDAIYTGMPTATVDKLTEKVTVDMWEVIPNFKALNYTRDLDVVYMFSTTQTPEEAAQNKYAKWHADFVVTFDKDLAKDSAGLGGIYGGWNVGFNAPIDIKAGEPLRLLGAVDINMNYEELCRDVVNFTCGAFNLDDANDGTTMTVELRLYEVEEPSAENGNSWNVETGKYITVGQYEYTFE